MPEIEVSIPDQLDSEIDRLVEGGEFINREQAIEELLSQGISVFATPDEESTSEVDENLFTQAVEDQQDPAMQGDDRDDGYSF